ncbi:MAG: hypothetical protein JJV99_06720 [Colwellia sp.]|nr:hypothetical protein [Colwellia sp.]
MINLFKDKEHQLKEGLSDIADKLDKPEDKWSFLYHYARKSLDEEISRFQRIDDKSVKLLSSVSIIITIFLALFKWILEDSNVEFSLYIYIVSILIFLSLSFSWHFFFKALKLRLAPRMPLNDEIFKLVQEKNMATIHVALYKSCQKAVKESFDVIEDKADKLKKGYAATSIAGFLLILFVSMLSYETVSSNLSPNTNGNTIMPSEENSNNQNSTNDPDLDITAPDHQLVTNDDKTPLETKVIENSQGK